MELVSTREDVLQISLDIATYNLELCPKILAQTNGKGIDIYNLELYSQKPKYPIDKEITSNVEKYQKALEVLLALKANGYEAFYGWKKGDGFWVSYQGHALRIQNGESGNPHFLMTSEALLLVNQFSTID